jgi:hypothetical protein
VVFITACAFGLALGQLLIEFASQFVDVRGFAESLHLLSRGFHIYTGVLTELLEHLEHHGELLLGEHSNLKIEMRAPLRLAGHAILADQHEDGQKHALRGNKQRQNSEGKGIERFYAWNQVEIRSDPSRNQYHMQKKKFRAADESYDGIALTFSARPASQGFLFQLGYGSDIKLRGIFRNLVRQCFIRGASAI